MDQDKHEGDELPRKNGEPKPPPWQVPKPELRPELQNPAGQSARPEDATPDPSGDGTAPGAVFDPFERERERELAGAAARKKRSQRRTVVVGLGVTALLAGTITAMVASSQEDPDYAQVCFNDDTGERVEDTQCNNSSTDGRSSGIYAWYFYSRGASVPGVGQNRSAYPSYTRTVPTGAKASTGYSSKGGTVSRGGFGGSAKGGSTGG
ncbi:MAG: putative Tat pathway signal sequence domain protein [Arthrobacter sp.]|nr:putative Tat pathway signal sequence domain protein [Arthrobacter sp.]